MQDPANVLFQDGLNHSAILADWGLTPTAQQLHLHTTLAARTVNPVESELRQAAQWLSSLWAYNQAHPRFDRHSLATALDDKSCLVHRLSYRHAPLLARELELPQSPLFAIDSAARLLPVDRDVNPQCLAALRRSIGRQMLPVEPPMEADATWHGNRRKLHELILHDNPYRFLTWPVVINSMFMNDSPVAAAELRTLEAQQDYTSRWLPALQEDSLGAPARTPLHSQSSNNLIHHACNLLQLELRSHIKIHQLSSIFEFGGGYGSTARLAFRLGFRGRYVIFDLPEFSALQAFYLGALGFPVGTAIHCVTDPSELPQLIPQPDLFLATWSLSETPLAFRQAFDPFLLTAQHLLLAYQESFGDADNMRYFLDLRQKLAQKAVSDYPIPHLPGNRYFVAAPGST